jgi:DNA mismatch repair ATPase MutS
MRQYLDVKRQHRDAIVFFRMGDFYEMFYEDALTASRVLELTLTSRAKDSAGGAIPMCGVPFHAAETYLGRLIRKGYRVAICDQVEDARNAKGIVKREVTRVGLAGHIHGRVLSRSARARVSRRALRRRPRWPLGSGISRCLDRRILGRRIRRPVHGRDGRRRNRDPESARSAAG